MYRPVRYRQAELRNISNGRNQRANQRAELLVAPTSFVLINGPGDDFVLTPADGCYEHDSRARAPLV
uniref:Cupin domain-containing protein n=1 Tax=Steinernema glaseri TaxID=37863 RepID=A0A1I7YRE1_9BILA